MAGPLTKEEITPRGEQSREGCYDDDDVCMCVCVSTYVHTCLEIQFIGTASILWVYKLTLVLLINQVTSTSILLGSGKLISLGKTGSVQS